MSEKIVMSEKIDRQPVGKFIAQAIRDVDTGVLSFIALFLTFTKTTDGYDEIVSAIRECIPGADNDASYWGAIALDILAQQREAAAEAHRRAEAQYLALYGPRGDDSSI